MERKSIGAFIAALRRANGMTQKELAEKLSVSDKSVSRWERDETAPDLYLIPVIAEIFGVTEGEILRGERNRSDIEQDEKSDNRKAAQTENVVRNMVKTAKTKFITSSLISALIALVGLIAAMMCNFAFFRMKLGFFIGCIFFAAAIITEIILAIRTFSLFDAENTENIDLKKEKRYILKNAEKITAFSLILFAFTLPLVTNSSYIISASLNFLPWLKEGIIYAIIAAVICFAAAYLADYAAVKKGFIYEEKRHTFGKTEKKYIKILIPTVLITIILHIVCLNVLDMSFFVKGTSFDDFESFAEYMSTPVNDYGSEIIILPGESTEWARDYLYDNNGNVIFEFLHIRQDISQIIEGDAENGYLPITVYSHDDCRTGFSILNAINSSIFILYPLEAVIIFVFYRKESKENIKKL
ncbi:MAG: helix-turn-helix domain-containing protein [Eubacteriales bacterium]